jgi:hypothetical protein
MGAALAPAIARLGNDTPTKVILASVTVVGLGAIFGGVGRAVGVRIWKTVADPTVATAVVRNALAVGDGQRAENVTAQAEHLAAANPDFATLAGAADHARGLLDGDRSALERALTEHRHPWARASASEFLGTLLTKTAKRLASDSIRPWPPTLKSAPSATLPGYEIDCITWTEGPAAASRGRSWDGAASPRPRAESLISSPSVSPTAR